MRRSAPFVGAADVGVGADALAKDCDAAGMADEPALAGTGAAGNGAPADGTADVAAFSAGTVGAGLVPPSKEPCPVCRM